MSIWPRMRLSDDLMHALLEENLDFRRAGFGYAEDMFVGRDDALTLFAIGTKTGRTQYGVSRWRIAFVR